MPSDPPHERSASDLYRSSIVVTGSHYSMTTLLGEVLALSPRYHSLHEPTNQWHPLGYRTVKLPHFYEFHVEERYPDLRAGLERLIIGEGLAGEIIRKVPRIRSLHDARTLVRLAETELPKRFVPRPAIIRDPFLAFTARTMQRVDAMRVVIGVRHPARWVESIARRDRGFDFAKFNDQPALLEALPDLADRIAAAARKPPSVVEQAVLAWICFQTFHARYMLGHERTLLVRQDDLVTRPREVAERLFAFAGVEVPAELDGFFARTMKSPAVDSEAEGRSYIERDSGAVMRKWRERLSADEQRLIRDETEELAAAFGFTERDWAEGAQRR